MEYMSLFVDVWPQNLNVRAKTSSPCLISAGDVFAFVFICLVHCYFETGGSFVFWRLFSRVQSGMSEHT